jgi:hypothetical protein
MGALAVALVAACTLAPSHLRTLAAAQAPGRSTFRVYQNGVLVGDVEMSLSATEGGWRLQGSSRIGGAVPVTIANLDLYYDDDWNGRFMTMEMKEPDDVIVHVAVAGTTTRTDIVRSTEARFRSHSVSPDTIFLPDRALGAYEAVAVRLTGAVAGVDLPLLIPPLGETRARVDAVATVQVTTGNGPITAKRYILTEIRERPTAVEIWVDRGRLLRLELPRASLTMVRSDVTQ